ncbi:MAG: hypothetical protein NC334_09535, partial [Bacteroides sp.]|nr:hypothetical protein [Bacteroides sp.]
MPQDGCSAGLVPAIAVQIELEKQMTQLSISSYQRELDTAKRNGLFGCTKVSTKLLSRILDDFSKNIEKYLKDYTKGKAVRSTMAAELINRLNNVEVVAYISAKVILNSLYLKNPVQSVYKAIGQALEDEFKMREFKDENSHYYKTIQEDLNKRGAKANRKKTITSNVFNKRLDFHLERWSITEKFQTGMVLVHLFIASTGLIEFQDRYKKGKHIKTIIPSSEFTKWIENTSEKLEVMQPFFLPMVCPPKPWTSVFEGGYVSPYLKRNKLIKNNDREY